MTRKEDLLTTVVALLVSTIALVLAIIKAKKQGKEIKSLKEEKKRLLIERENLK